LLFGSGAVGVRSGGISDDRLQPSYDTSTLQNFYVIAIDQIFDLPNNVLILLTKEDECGASNVALCVEFIDSIIEHDSALRDDALAGRG
jgi:hypothetical protein